MQLTLNRHSPSSSTICVNGHISSRTEATARLSLLKDPPEFFLLSSQDNDEPGGGTNLLHPPICIVIRDINAEGGDYYHYLAINAESDMSEGTLILPYEAPWVPGHKCLYEIYTQAGYFSLSGSLGRQTTNFGKLTQEMDLQLVARVVVTTASDITGLCLSGRASQLSPRKQRLGTQPPSSQLSPRLTSVVHTR